MKIDTSTIPNYDTLPDDVRAAIEAIEMPETQAELPDMSKFVAKDTFDKKASEAAEWKRKYNSTLSDAEKQKQADEEARAATNARLAELERKDKISTAKDQYIASGFAVDLALATAEAFVDGKMDEVFANINKHAQNVATAAKDAALKETPAPPASGNGNPGSINYEKELEEAFANKDMTRAAQLMRLKHEQK